MRHFVVVGVLVILVAVLTYIGLDSMGLMPVAASAQAHTDRLDVELAGGCHFISFFTDHCADDLQHDRLFGAEKVIPLTLNISKAIPTWRSRGPCFPCFWY